MQAEDPLGATQMFFTETKFSIGILGALIVIMATAYDPFIQQLLTLPTKTVYKPSEFSWIVQPKTLPPGGQALAALLDEPLSNAISTNSTRVFDASPTCAAMNCTYDAYQSLGFCAKCVDVTSSVKLGNCSLVPDSFAGYQEATRNNDTLTKMCSLQWNEEISDSIEVNFNGSAITTVMPLHYINLIYNHSTIMAEEYAVNGGVRLGGDIMYTKNITALNISNPLLVMGQADFVATDDLMLEIGGAKMCTLDLCLKRYDINVTYNIPFVEARNEIYGLKFNVSSSGSVENIMGSFWNCWTPNLTSYHAHVQEFDPVNVMPTPEAQDDFTFCYEPALNQYMTIADSISPYLPGIISADNLTFAVNSSGQLINHTVHNNETWFSPPAEKLFQMGLESFAWNASTAITQAMITNADTKAFGKTGFAMTFVRVRWVWFTLPLLTEILGVVFMILTIRVASKHHIPLWKASVLPYLFHGLEHETEELSTDVVRMQEIAENLKVSLSKANDNGRLVLKEHID